MSDPNDIDRELADCYERLAALHRRRSESTRRKPRKRPVVPVQPQDPERVKEVERILHRKGIAI